MFSLFVVRPGPHKRKLGLSDVFIGVLIVVVGILVYPKIFGRDKSKVVKDSDGRISITVLPFTNLTGDSSYYVWQVGVQNLLINTLSNSKEISVIHPETMASILSATRNINYASITPSIGSEIALKLETNTFILGNILKAGSKIRIGVQLRDAATQEIYKSYEVDGDSEGQIFMMADSLSRLLMNFLEIKVLEQDVSYDINKMITTSSPEAYRYYIKGCDLFFNNLDYSSSIEFFNKALEKSLEIDTKWGGGWKWVHLYHFLGTAYHKTGQHGKEKEIYELGLSISPGYPTIIYNQAVCALSQGDTSEAHEFLEKYSSVREEEGWEEYRILNDFGSIYRNAEHFDEAEKYFKQVIEENPKYRPGWTRLAYLYFTNDINIDEGMELIKHAYEIDPNSYYIMYLEGMGLFKQGNLDEALELLNKSWDLRYAYHHHHYQLIQEVEQALASQNQ